MSKNRIRKMAILVIITGKVHGSVARVGISLKNCFIHLLKLESQGPSALEPQELLVLKALVFRALESLEPQA
nr:hypothetical protein [Tanacetum cinerariifolium]